MGRLECPVLLAQRWSRCLVYFVFFLVWFEGCLSLPFVPGKIIDDQYKTDVDKQWDAVVQTIWSVAKPRISFCLGASEEAVLDIMQASFPMPLPVGPPEDPVCSNSTETALHMCGPAELLQYYKVGLFCLISTWHTKDLSPCI